MRKDVLAAVASNSLNHQASHLFHRVSFAHNQINTRLLLQRVRSAQALFCTIFCTGSFLYRANSVHLPIPLTLDLLGSPFQ